MKPVGWILILALFTFGNTQSLHAQTATEKFRFSVLPGLGVAWESGDGGAAWLCEAGMGFYPWERFELAADLLLPISDLDIGYIGRINYLFGRNEQARLYLGPGIVYFPATSFTGYGGQIGIDVVASKSVSIDFRSEWFIEPKDRTNLLVIGLGISYYILNDPSTL